MEKDTEEKLDSVVSSIILKFRDRAVMGKRKYGTDLDRTDLSVLDWIQHAQEEHMDAILYLEKLKRELTNKTYKNDIILEKMVNDLEVSMKDKMNESNKVVKEVKSEIYEMKVFKEDNYEKDL
jgi:hypothetical protein